MSSSIYEEIPTTWTTSVFGNQIKCIVAAHPTSSSRTNWGRDWRKPGEILTIYDVQRQSRMVVRDERMRYFSIPVDYSTLHFRIIQHDSASSKSYSVSNILTAVNAGLRSVQIIADNDEEIAYIVKDNVEVTEKLGKLLFLDTYNEKYILANDASSERIAISVNSAIRFHIRDQASAVDIDKTSMRNLRRKLRKLSKEPFDTTLSNDIFLIGSHKISMGSSMYINVNATDKATSTTDIQESSFGGPTSEYNYCPLTAKSSFGGPTSEYSYCSLVADKNTSILMLDNEAGSHLKRENQLKTDEYTYTNGKISLAVDEYVNEQMPVHTCKKGDNAAMQSHYANSESSIIIEKATDHNTKSEKQIQPKSNISPQDSSCFEGFLARDVKSFSVDDVEKCLRLLKFDRYVDGFVERDVDGALLQLLNEKILVKEFGFDSFDAKKLMLFIRKGWRPQRV